MRKLCDQRFLLSEDCLRQRERVLLVAPSFQRSSLQLNDECVLRQFAVYLFEKNCGTVILLSGIRIVCAVIESSRDGLVKARGHQRLVFKFTVDAGGRLLDRIHERLAGFAAGKWIAASQQILREKLVDGVGNRGLALGDITFANRFSIKREAKSQSGRERNYSQNGPGTACPGRRQFTFGNLCPELCIFQFVALDPALLDGKKALDQISRTIKALGRIATRRICDILAQERILDFRFPTRRQRLTEVSDDQLVQHDAQSIDVGTGARRLPSQNLGREIHQGSSRSEEHTSELQ